MKRFKIVKTNNLQDVPQMINDSPLTYQFTATKDVLMYDDIELKCPYRNYDKISWLKVCSHHANKINSRNKFKFMKSDGRRKMSNSKNLYILRTI